MKLPVARPVVLLLGCAIVALVAAASVRLESRGLTTHLLENADPLTIEPGTAIPASAEVTSYVGPAQDPGALWQIGHMIDAWTATGRKIDQLPAAQVVARGTLRVPVSGSWTLSMEPAPGGGARLWVDGKVFPSTSYLAAGRHDFQLSFKSDAPAPFTLTADGPGFPKAGVPDGWLSPEDGTPLSFWALVLTGLALVGGVAALVARNRALLRELEAWAPVLVVVIAMAAGTTLRAHGRLAAPKVGDTYDEYQEAWQGWSLVHLQKPIAWGFPPWQQAYRGHGKMAAMNFFGRQLLIVQPYMEHPPLFSLLVGISGTLAGAAQPFAVRLSAIRRVPLLLSLFFYPLLYAIARRLHGRHAAALACLVFAVAPPFVLIMRFAKGDLLAALLAAVSIWAGLRWREAAGDERVRRRWLVVCAVAAGLAPLAKELGIFALVLPPLLLAPPRRAARGLSEAEHVDRLRAPALGLGIALAVLLLYPLYGAIVDWERFLVFLRIQGASRLGRFDVATVFVETILLNWKNQQVTWFASGWVLFWLATFWSLRGRGRLLATIALLYLATIVAAVDGRWLYGWYELPLFLPLAACAGLFLWETCRAPDLAKPLALLLLGVLPLATLLVTVPDADKMHQLRMAIAIAGLPFGAHAVVRAPFTRTLARVAAIALVVVFIVSCAVLSWQIDRFYPGFALAA